MCIRESLLHWGGVGIGQGQSHLLDDQGIFEMTHHVQTDVTHVRPLPYHKNADENEEDGCQYANSVNYKKKKKLFHVVCKSFNLPGFQERHYNACSCGDQQQDNLQNSQHDVDQFYYQRSCV